MDNCFCLRDTEGRGREGLSDFRLLRLSNERIIDLNLNNRWAQWENR